MEPLKTFELTDSTCGHGVMSLLALILRCFMSFGPLKTKRRLLYLKTQFVPRSKHFSSRL